MTAPPLKKCKALITEPAWCELPEGHEGPCDAATVPREPTQDELEKIRKRVMAEHKNDTGGGSQRAIAYQLALIRAGYELKGKQ